MHDMDISEECTVVRVLICTVQVYSSPCVDRHSVTSVQLSVC